MENRKNNFLILIILFLIALDLAVWILIFAGNRQLKNPEINFLNIGQGDASLVILPGPSGSIKMLIDGGQPNGLLEKNLEKILPAGDRYIDLVMNSHPQLDHFGGFINLFKEYKIGAVLTSQATSENISWKELEKIIKEKNINRIILSAGDKIKYEDYQFDILSPGLSDYAKDINDFSLVTILRANGIKAFFGGDISGEKEKDLADRYDVDVDILKVSHHGSRFSSNLEFLKEASPLVSVIEVGKNTYGHPTKEALSRLASISPQIYRTDLNGLVKIIIDNGGLKIYNQQ